MSRLEGFPPIALPHAHTLILGSMPGAASLAAGQYYAHPRNGFWPIVCAVLGLDAARPYAERARLFAERGYALWDVLGACRREGSLDADIEPESMEVNDFAAFFAAHPGIGRVFLNGTAAATLFRRHVAPGLDERIAWLRLPSTSPANASCPYATQLAAWQEIAR
ncbi:T/U mismatch-specific DNA glycosylase [Azoarcus sp. CIB]|uniref:DNA-deoxyinosine glycosylase n=1 Tax=Aromatoleum sp. (strain CIB) TaxID=198107 RepID=UPI00067E39B4|nr:DNA-deoxyinosine glycosylase [Azoarcus sp. CIB]AKU10460.1 T/U mismatch-specific DNA glycosylase [Azoarcus sp. CIB]